MLNNRHRFYKRKFYIKKLPPPGDDQAYRKSPLLIFQEVLSLMKTLKGTKQTKRDEPDKEERQAKKMHGGKERIKC